MEKSGRAENEVVAMPEPEVEEDDVMLPGFRFHPTDEELVDFYLRRKVEKKPLSIEIIKEMDVYKHEPWDLPKFMITAGEKEWYFFCRRGRKYRNSVRPNRVTGCGFWKATGVDRRIQSAAHHFIGLKKSLVYYRGHAGKGTKTDWMMHEFRLPDDSAAAAASATVSKNAATMQEAEVWTICRIFKRSAASYKKQPSSYQTSITTPTKSPPESSSLTNCCDTDDYVCCTSSAGGLLADQLQLHHRHHHLNHPHPLQVHTTADLVGSGAWTSISNNSGGGQALFPANSLAMATVNEQISPSSNDFMRDSIWDELGRISEFLADDDAGFPPNDSGYASYTLEIDNII